MFSPGNSANITVEVLGTDWKQRRFETYILERELKKEIVTVTRRNWESGLEEWFRFAQQVLGSGTVIASSSGSPFVKI
jgi:hypothetical protein